MKDWQFDFRYAGTSSSTNASFYAFTVTVVIQFGGATEASGRNYSYKMEHFER